MENEERPEEESCSLGPGPFLFSGKPPFIQGTVNVINRSAEKVRVQPVAIGDAGLKPDRTRGLSEAKVRAAEGQQLDALRVRVSKYIGPNDEANLPAQLVIDKFTPPGEYKAQVLLGDQQAEALIFVLENHSLRLVPNQISITAAPGETITRSIYITNEGNVPFSTRKAAFAPLQELDMLHTSLAIALTEAGHAGHEKFLDRFVEELSNREVQPAKIKIDIQNQEIAPGETKSVEVRIQLPAELKKKRTYTSVISFRTARLDVEVDVRGNA